MKLIQTKIVVPVTLDLCSKHVTFDVQSISAQCFRGVSFLDQGIKQWTMSKASWGALDVQHSGCSVPSALGKAQKTTAQTVEITSSRICTPNQPHNGFGSFESYYSILSHEWVGLDNYGVHVAATPLTLPPEAKVFSLTWT